MRFGEDFLRHCHSGSKLSEVALICALDMCRAATHVRPGGDVKLRELAFDICHEIKVRSPYYCSNDDSYIRISTGGTLENL
jgi:neurofibromin 1